jgi:hypothetical protein
MSARRGPKLKLDLVKRMEVIRTVKAEVRAGVPKCEIYESLAKLHNVSRSTIERTVNG